MLLITVVLSSPASAAETINVADYGVVPGRDATLPLSRLIETIKSRPDVTLVFPSGQYDFFPGNAVQRYRAVANHDNGLKAFGLPLFGCRNLTIDGGGSTFLFHGRMVPITIESSSGVTLRNLTIDWVRSFHAELRVVESGSPAEGFVVEADPSAYPFQIVDGQVLFDRYGQLDPIGSNIVFDPATHAPIVQTKSYSINGKRTHATLISENRFRLQGGTKKNPPIGSVLVVYGVHPTSRLCPAIHVTNSVGLTIERVTVHDAGGMGLIVERTDGVTLDEMVVSSNSDRLVSTRADATHFIGCRGEILVENCRFEHMLDDGINVHGAYVRVEERLGENELLCEISHFQQWGLTFAEAGDKVALISRTTLSPLAETSIVAVRPLNEKRFVVELESLPEELPTGPLSLENLTWYPDLVFRNNVIRQNRARSILVTSAGKVLIESNRLSSQMHGILIEGDNNKWYESGAVKDVVVRNNVFENIGQAVDRCYPLRASPLLTPAQRHGEVPYHRNILFEDNTVRSFNGLLAKATSVGNLTIRGNQVVLSDDYPQVNEGPAIDLEHCKRVSIADNAFKGFDHEIAVASDESTKQLAVGDNIGLKSRGGRPSISSPTPGKPISQGTQEQPNIVLLFVDDLGWNDLGCRDATFETPEIDRLARDGVDFVRAYVPSPTCSPSRAALLTGKHPARLRLVRHIPVGPKHDGFDKSGRAFRPYHHWEGDPAQLASRNWLPLEHTTYAESLRELGYRNHFIGKWHLGHEPYHPRYQGFQTQYGTTNFGHPNSYNAPFFVNSTAFEGLTEGHLTDELTKEAERIIHANKGDRPFTLSLWYYGVHRPPLGRSDLVEHFLATGLDKPKAIYAAQVKAIDESLGRIREALRRRGLAEKTAIILASDQGSWYTNAPLRGTKRVDTLCEGGARVPLIAYWPGVTEPGTVCHEWVQTTDLFPTMVEMAGGDPGSFPQLDGVSLKPLLLGEEAPTRNHPLIGYRAYQDLYASVRERPWNLLAYRSGRVELYNVVDDIREEADVAAEHPDVVNRLTNELIRWEQEVGLEAVSGVQ